MLKKDRDFLRLRGRIGRAFLFFYETGGSEAGGSRDMAEKEDDGQPCGGTQEECSPQIPAGRESG